MKRSDLLRKYADVMDMCEGTNVRPLLCVRVSGENVSTEPCFNGNAAAYTFALAIVEDRPVFAGDMLYHRDGRELIITNPLNTHSLYVKEIATPVHIYLLTWTKPDPFAEILKAKAEGERVVFYDGANWIDTDSIDTVNFKPESYKVAEADEGTITGVLNPFGCIDTIRVKWHKCGITGKITAEVIE